MPLLDQLFTDMPLPTKSLPRFYPVTFQGHCRYYHERGSCCLYFKVSDQHYCTSCPLIDEDERLKRNQEWLEKTILLTELC